MADSRFLTFLWSTGLHLSLRHALGLLTRALEAGGLDSQDELRHKFSRADAESHCSKGGGASGRLGPKCLAFTPCRERCSERSNIRESGLLSLLAHPTSHEGVP